ncbi:MAG: GTP cyclohydrolase FolE2 [Candidatus Accumulibacter sp. UW26]|jgi:GTP cyclohydrolase I
MNAPDCFFLPDIQARADLRQLAIHKVGVKGLRYPLALLDAAGKVQHTVAELSMAVGLPPEVKGTHMSRFVEILEQPRPPLDAPGLLALFDDMLLRLDAQSGEIELAFPYFIRKAAPVSGVESLLDYDVRMIVRQRPGRAREFTLEIVAPVTSLCPCSKEISDYGAHNQRSHLTISARLRSPMSPDELVRLAEDEASCEVYGLLKRPDEKWVTERAYDNPKFVEDLVRDLALRLMNEPRIARWTVRSENFESIHNHSAYAQISGENGRDEKDGEKSGHGDFAGRGERSA